MAFVCSRCGFRIPEIPKRPAPRCPRCWTTLAGASGFSLPEPGAGESGSGALSPLEAALPALPRDPGPGDRVAGCRLLEEWSRREGVVTFQALQEEEGEDLLLSLHLGVAPAGPELKDGLDREAARARRLDVAGLWPLVEWGVEEGFPYLAHRGKGRGLRSWNSGHLASRAVGVVCILLQTDGLEKRQSLRRPFAMRSCAG